MQTFEKQRMLVRRPLIFLLLLVKKKEKEDILGTQNLEIKGL